MEKGVLKMGKIKLNTIIFHQMDGEKIVKTLNNELAESLVESVYGKYQWSIDGENWREPDPKEELVASFIGNELYYRYKGLNH